MSLLPEYTACPKCQSPISKSYIGIFECGVGINMPWSSTTLCDIIQRYNKAEACIKELEKRILELELEASDY